MSRVANTPVPWMGERRTTNAVDMGPEDTSIIWPMKDAIFFNPRCSNCRVSLELLKEHGIDVPVIEYLNEPPDIETLKEVCGLLGVRPHDLVRQKEAIFK